MSKQEQHDNGHDREKKEENKQTKGFWNIGEGSSRRMHNIQVIKGLIQEGKDYNEIMRIARSFFTSKRINEYFIIAIEELEECSKIDNDVKTLAKMFMRDNK